MITVRHTFALVTVAACVSSARAGLVTLSADPSSIALNPSADAAMRTRYRLSATNWDAVIVTSNLVSNSTIAASAGLGTAAQLNGASWAFVISYDPSSGYLYSLTAAGGGSPATTATTLVWNAPIGSKSPFASHDVIQLQVYALSSMPSGVTSASIAVSDLAFSAVGFSTIGSLSSMNQSWVSGTTGISTQWIRADQNLATTAWTLSGTVTAMFTGTSNPGLDERLKFDVVTQASIPAPAAWITLTAAIVLPRRGTRRR